MRRRGFILPVGTVVRFNVESFVSFSVFVVMIYVIRSDKIFNL